MSLKKVLLSGFLSLLFCSPLWAATEISNLRTEYQKNPIGLDLTHPRFSWEMSSSNRGARQTAFRIVVTSDKAGLKAVWNSGKIKTDQSLNNRYAGDSLRPSTRYYWHVEVWDNQQKKVASTETAFFETGLMHLGWGEASWIKAQNPAKAENGGIPLFRKVFRLEEKSIRSARIYASALGVYDLFINGKRVGTTTTDGRILFDELKPGWTDYTKTAQYSTYDVTKWIQAKDNVLGAQVASGWWKGAINHNEYLNPQLSFIARMDIEYTDGSKTSIVSDTTWLTSYDGPIRMAEIYDGETYDANLESNWKTLDFIADNWAPALRSDEFKGKLKAFTGPNVQVRSELTRNPVSTTIYSGTKDNATALGTINVLRTGKGSAPMKLAKGETLLLDMGQNMVGWIQLTAKAQAGTQLQCRFGEMLNDSGLKEKGNDGPAGSLYTANLRNAKASIHYTFKGSKEGETYHPSYTFFGFRYCEITATEDLEILDVQGQVVGTANEDASSFKTNSASINQLYSNILWGQRGNFLSIPTDCPQRDERLGWTGDTQIFSRAATYNANTASFYRKWMGDMRDSQRKDGAYPDVAPHAWVGYGQGAWAEAGIVVPWNVYLMYNDTEILAENYESMEKFMGFLAAQAGNGFRYNGGGANYGDWVSYEKTDPRYVCVCYYAYAAQLMAKISGALSQKAGDRFDMKEASYGSLFKKIKNEFQNRYVNPDGSLKETSQTAYLLALKMNLLPNAEARSKGIDYLTRKISDNGNKLSTGFVGTGILNQTLSEFGAGHTAYNLLLQRDNPSWLYSVDQGATTIWERWDSYTLEKGFQDVNMNSFNHYAYGAVGEWMFRYMAGIEVDEFKPGFKHIKLQPTLDQRSNLGDQQERITSVEASYASMYGPIRSAWKISKNKLSYNVSIPANTTATLDLPFAGSNKDILEGSVLAEKASGVKFIRCENGKVIYELKSGTYNFKQK